MKIVLFSEEYEKVTPGLVNVWLNHAREASKEHRVDILLNHEHWAFDEAGATLGAAATVHRLPFDMPGTLLKRAFRLDGRPRLRAARSALARTLNRVFSPLIILFLYARLRGMRPDAVFSHSGGWPSGQLGRWIIVAAALARVPARVLIIHSHPLKITRSYLAPLRFLQARLMDLCATSLVAVSDSVKAALESEGFKRPLVRIHNGIPAVPGKEGAPLGWQPSGPAVGFAGALNAAKGPQVLLDAFRLVETPCELTLLGPAEDPAFLKTLEQKAALCANKVSFLGFHQNVDSFMEKIDLLVVPAIAAESFSLVVLEAMKHKKPVVCSDFGGMKEVVQDGATGIVTPAGDAPALAAAIAKLLADEGLRTRLGAAGHRRLNELFTSEKMALRYDELLPAAGAAR
ncbi:MAG: glycosyltransferase family 4 protein [Elusimicrobiota bacterium]